MSSRGIYPDSIEELFTPDALVRVLLYSRSRLLERVGVAFDLAAYRIPTLCELYLGSANGPKYAVRERVRLVGESEALVRMRQAAARLCFWMCDLRLVEGTQLAAGASDQIRTDYPRIEEYRTELFSLLSSYDFYRHYASRMTSRIAADWFAGRKSSDVFALCAALAQTPHNSSAIFRKIAG